MKDFIRYKSLIQELADNLDTQWTRLKSTCETLLTGLTVPDEDLSCLLEDPTSSVWRKEYLVEQLESRLQGSYSTVQRILGRLAGTLQDLNAKIGLDSQGRPQWADRKTQKRCWARFATCLRRKEHESLILQMAQENGYLRDLVIDSLRLEPQRSQGRNRKKPLSRIRDHAARLHSALRSGWSCGCSAVHCAELRLERREWDQPPCFQVTFPLHSTRSTTWHETEIRASCTAAAQTAYSETVNSTAYVSKEGTHLSPPHARLNAKKKKVAWGAIAPAMEAAKLSLIDTRAAQEQPSLKQEAREIHDLCSVLRCDQRQSANGMLGRLTDDKSHYEVVSLIHHDSANIGTSTLHDLLMDHSHGHSIAGEIPLSICTSISTKDPRLTRKARLQLAVTLASTSLQLFTTPWLDNDWSGKKVYLRWNSVDSPYISCAFIKPGQPPSITQTASQSAWSPIRNQSIFRLGVLLLELALGKPLDFYMTDDRLLPYGDYKRASELVKTLVDEESENYISATKACIHSDFGSKVKELDFEDNSFRQAVYEDVVQPLEQDLEFFYKVPFSQAK